MLSNATAARAAYQGTTAGNLALINPVTAGLADLIRAVSLKCPWSATAVYALLC